MTRLRVVIRRPSRVLRIPPDDVDVPICLVGLEHEEERDIQQGYRQQRV